MKKTVGILAHVDAGKTTFAEQILYYGESIKTRGRVDHKNSFLDSHSIEKDRGITVFSDQGIFNYKGSTYYLIDTPGHIDFSSEMERAIQVMDYAIIIVNGAEGIQSHTETLWQLLRKYKIPTFFFINKIDRVGVDIHAVLKEIRSNLTENTCYITELFNKGEMSEELIEFIAMQDEYLLDKYLEDAYDEKLWLDSMKNMIKENKIFPCFSGSALQDIGIVDFLDKFHLLTYTDYSTKGDFSGYVYKIRYDGQGTKVTYIKALSGGLKVKDEISYGDEDNRIYEKVNEIRIYNGNKFIMKDEVLAGELFAVPSLSQTKVGQGLGTLKKKFEYQMVPTLKSKVIFDNTLNSGDVLKYFRILEEEDPVLNVVWDENLEEIHLHIIGTIQLEVLKKLVKERFDLNIDFGPCEIFYKETINKETIGYGHFEPMGHYAEVHLNLEPGERDSGILFESLCSTEDLSIGQQNLIRSHIYEKAHRGILTGSPITDIKITLLTGRGNKEHTSGGDFREASYRALRQGLEKTENELLEPYYSFKIEAELAYMGRIISDIQKLHGSFNTPEILKDKIRIIGRGPVATFMDYTKEFVSFTKGKGIISFKFHGYDICHNKDEIIKKINYNKDADPSYTSNSIFFTKGQAYVVKGSEAEEHMHCL